MDHVGAVLGPLVAIGILYAFLGPGLWQGGTESPGASEMAALRWLFAMALVPGLAAIVTLVAKVREVAPPQARQAGGVRGKLPRRFYGYVSIVTLFALGNSSDMFLILYARTRFGLSLLGLVSLWVVLHLSKIAFSLPGGALSDRVGRRPLIVGAWVVYAFVYLGLALASAQWQFWALFVLYGAYYGLCEGAEKALVADFVPADCRATAFGLYHGAIGMAALPASLMFGLFWKAIGPAWAFGIGAGIAGLAAVSMLVLLSAVPPVARRG
jgi:MFS family permease